MTAADSQVATGSAQDGDDSFQKLWQESHLVAYGSLWRLLVSGALPAVALWLLLWWLAPDVIVSSRSEVDTLRSALPGAAVALLAVVIAGLLVAVQVVAASSRSIGVWVLVRDQRIWGLVLLLAGMAVVTLVLAGLSPGEGDPSDALTAALTTLIVMLAGALLASGQVIKVRLGEYTNPIAFVRLAAAPANRALDDGDWPRFEGHVAEIGQLASDSLQGRDPRILRFSLDALEQLHRDFLDKGDTGASRKTVSAHLSAALIRAGEEWIKLDLGSTDVQAITSSLYRMARDSLERGDEPGAIEFTYALGRLATRSWTFATESYFQTEPATPLEGFASLASEATPGDLEVAASALECWALGVVYLHWEAAARSRVEKLMARNVTDESVKKLGPAPSWQSAIDHLDTQRSWRRWSAPWRDDARKLLEALADAAQGDSTLTVEDVISRELADAPE